MTWHLMSASLKEVENSRLPDTHMFRTISHEEFGNMVEHLEINQQDGQIKIRDPATALILSRLGRGDVEVVQDDCAPDFIQHDTSMGFVEPEDFVLVFFQNAQGTYVYYQYQQAEEESFKNLVDTGIIEPRDSEAIIPIRIVTLAKQIVALDNRIRRVDRLLQRPSERYSGLERRNLGSDGHHFAEMLKKYNAERNKLLADPILDKSRVANVLQHFESTRDKIIEKRRKAELNLQIENDIEERWEERFRLEDTITLLDTKLDSIDEKIEALEALLSEIEGVKR